MPDKTLIIAPAWVGDMVMSHVLVQQLLADAPNQEIHMLAPAATLDLAQRMPGVKHGILGAFAHGALKLRERLALAKQLRKENYQQAIVLPNSFKSALIPWAAKIEKRTGWRGESRFVVLNDIRKLDKNALPLMVDRFFALALPAFCAEKKTDFQPLLTVDTKNIDKLREAFQLADNLPIVALCPGAEFGPSKQWPAQHFSTLANECIESGFQVWILGSPGDTDIAREIVQKQNTAGRKSENIFDLTGRTALLDAVDLLQAADVVVSNDSGLMHIACAVHTPVVCIYGSTTPEFTPPLSKHAKVLQSTIACRPCFARQCPLGHLQCLQEISAAQVFAEVRALMPELSIH